MLIAEEAGTGMGGVIVPFVMKYSSSQNLLVS